jgi:hypothetical protein
MHSNNSTSALVCGVLTMSMNVNMADAAAAWVLMKARPAMYPAPPALPALNCEQQHGSSTQHTQEGGEGQCFGDATLSLHTQ